VPPVDSAPLLLTFQGLAFAIHQPMVQYYSHRSLIGHRSRRQNLPHYAAGSQEQLFGLQLIVLACDRRSVSSLWAPQGGVRPQQNQQHGLPHDSLLLSPSSRDLPVINMISYKLPCLSVGILADKSLYQQRCSPRLCVSLVERNPTAAKFTRFAS
jgi:hypothetical protein